MHGITAPPSAAAPGLFAVAQIESSMAVQSLKPRIDMMKGRYGDDKKKIQRETSILYEQAGVNPLAGESSWDPLSATVTVA